MTKEVQFNLFLFLTVLGWGCMPIAMRHGDYWFPLITGIPMIRITIHTWNLYKELRNESC